MVCQWLSGAPFSLLQMQGLSLAGALVGFEGRVVFYAFASYIKLPAPWNWVAVTVALFGLAAVVLAQHTGALGTTVDFTIAGMCDRYQQTRACTARGLVLSSALPV